MSNSSLVKYKILSPNHSGRRTHSIDRITPHCVVGQLSAQGIAGCFPRGRDASCNYGIGTNGDIVLIVDEGNRSWCSSSNANDQRAVTIECASDRSEPYWMNNKVYSTLIELCIDICKRNGKNKLIWIPNRSQALAYNPKSNEMLLTVHRWFANKSCPGNWLYSRLGDVANKVTSRLNGGKTIDSGAVKSSDLINLSENDVIEKIGRLFTEDNKKSGVLASVSMAQFILESGWGKSELAQNANNFFGMKKSLSGNNWSGSAWDGSSVYKKQTQEYDGSKYITVTAEFRKYPNIEKSIADHSAYLLGAKNGNNLRYVGLKNEKNYKKAITIIKNGGYATSPTYIEKLCNIIEKWNLTRFDYIPSDTSKGVPFTVKVLIDNLNYRSEPSMKGIVKGQTGKGIFTILEVKNGWGRLKSGVGWIYLENPNYCTVNGHVSSKKSIDEIAREVIQGKWGNGEDRKNKLSKAGYDYSTVQNRVNQLL